ncbi:hypothetical protein HBO02_21825 [Pseudomonas proteolytica]|uniref:hypothetical protein n=1 Tax=Pseudomonas proteolytica TaxID=219574 RepID=UPI0014728ACA|nr:hypothetical protein [Pseudomonas proteolytica]NMZ25061.1 hypothetical protein [Pseudomonas proteolytica]
MSWEVVSCWIEGHPGLASWVQAFGSISAIIYAVRIANKQFQRSVEQQKKEEVLQNQRLVGYAGRVFGAMKDTFEGIENYGYGVDERLRSVIDLKDIAEVVENVGLDNVKDLDLCIEWIHLRHCLKKFISALERDRTFSNSTILEEMAPILHAANVCRDDMLKISETM